MLISKIQKLLKITVVLEWTASLSRSKQARRVLEQQQYELLNCLLENGPAPAAVDHEHLAHTAAALRSKRRRGIVRSMSKFCQELGEDFDLYFCRYISQFPSAHPAGHRSDAAGFVGFVRKRQACRHVLVTLARFKHLRGIWAGAKLPKQET